MFVGSFDPHLLVLLTYSLAVADCFPEELVREIFSIDFLGKLDAQLESTSPLCLLLCLEYSCVFVSVANYSSSSYVLNRTNVTVFLTSQSPTRCSQHADQTPPHGAQPRRVS